MRCRREVAFLLAHRVAEPGLPRVPMALRRVDEIARLVLRERVRNLVEDEELALRPHVRGVCDPGRSEILLRALGDEPRVLRVALARDRIGDLTKKRQRRRLRERIEDRGRRVRHQQHVRLGDPLPAADRGAVEAEPVVERRLVERGDRQRHVLPGSEQVAELEVDHLRGRLASPLQRFARVGCRRLAVREVVLRLFRCHAAPSDSDHKKRAQDSQS